MTTLKDETIRRKILDALCASEQGDCVQFTRPAREGMSRLCPEISQPGMVNLLKRWVQGGGEIDQAKDGDARTDWKKLHKYHYDFRIKIAGVDVYIETRLLEDRADCPELFIVNYKEA